MVHQLRQNLVGSDVLSLCFEGDTDAMAHDIHGHGTYVLGSHKPAVLQKGVGLRSDAQTDAGTWRGAKGEEVLEVSEAAVFMIHSGKHQVNDLALDFLINVDVQHQLSRLVDGVLADHVARFGEPSLLQVGSYNLLLFSFGRVANYNLQ